MITYTPPNKRGAKQEYATDAAYALFLIGTLTMACAFLVGLATG